MRNPGDAYLNELRRHLRSRPLLVRRVVAEVADHLKEATAAGVSSGLSLADAEEAAVRQLGPASLVAQRYSEVGPSLGWLVIAASCATAGIAIWLFFLTAFAPTTRYPGDLVVLRSLSIGFMTYSALSGASVRLGTRLPVLRSSAFWLSFAAVALGCLHVGPAIVAASTGRHFDGYVLFVGAVLAAHGVVTIAYTLLEEPLLTSASDEL